MEKQDYHSNSLGDVYPLHTLDDTKFYRFFLSGFTYSNDILDAEKLQDALSKLLEIGDWRKLGGRLKMKNGKLEIHVPQKFTESQPAVAFTHDTFDMNIETHPIASRFPKPTRGPSTQPISDDFRPFLIHHDHPMTIEEMIHQNLPQLSLHISSFSDATLISLTWPHTLMDASGHQSLLQAWSLMLAGRAEEIPMFLGARKDILEEIIPHDDERHEEFGLSRTRMTGMGKLKFIFQHLWEKLWNPRRELRVIFLPKDTFTRFQKRVRDEVAEIAHTNDQELFVSDGDILTAWATSVVASSLLKPRPMTVVNMLNIRFRLSPLIESGGIYLQNMVLAGYAFLSAQLARGPLGPIALSHRSHLVEQTSEQQTLSQLQTVRQDIKSSGSPNLLYGEPHAGFVFVNNLTKLGTIQAANFRPAVLRQGQKGELRSNPPGSMVTFQNYFHPNSTGPVDALWIFGQDHGGNYWLEGNFLPRAWEILEKELRDM